MTTAELPVEGLTADDRDRLAEIATTDDPLRLAQLLHQYYRDADRADRTPRAWLYLHLGLLAGRLERVATVRLMSSRN